RGGRADRGDLRFEQRGALSTLGCALPRSVAALFLLAGCPWHLREPLPGVPLPATALPHRALGGCGAGRRTSRLAVNANHPRVLVVSESCISAMHGTGTLLLRHFAGWPEGRLWNLYLGPKSPHEMSQAVSCGVL